VASQSTWAGGLQQFQCSTFFKICGDKGDATRLFRVYVGERVEELLFRRYVLLANLQYLAVFCCPSHLEKNPSILRGLQLPANSINTKPTIPFPRHHVYKR